MTLLARGHVDGLRLRDARPVQVGLVLDGTELALDALPGRPLALQFSGRVRCSHCGRTTARSYARGACYDCFTRLAACDLCIVSPDRCHRHMGTCRQPLWGDEHCMRPHLVYLANSSGLKVGMTRAARLPGRWLDQGAVQATVMAWAGSRRIAGLIEKALGVYVSEHTDWRLMLQAGDHVDLTAAAQRLRAPLYEALAAVRGRFGPGAAEVVSAGREWQFEWPGIRTLYRPQSFVARAGFAGVFGGELLGMKGQYLVFDAGVVNMAAHRGFELEVHAGLPAGVPAQPDLFS